MAWRGSRPHTVGCRSDEEGFKSPVAREGWASRSRVAVEEEFKRSNDGGNEVQMTFGASEVARLGGCLEWLLIISFWET